MPDVRIVSRSTYLLLVCDTYLLYWNILKSSEDVVLCLLNRGKIVSCMELTPVPQQLYVASTRAFSRSRSYLSLFFTFCSLLWTSKILIQLCMRTSLHSPPCCFSFLRLSRCKLATSVFFLTDSVKSVFVGVFFLVSDCPPALLFPRYKSRNCMLSPRLLCYDCPSTFQALPSYRPVHPWKPCTAHWLRGSTIFFLISTKVAPRKEQKKVIIQKSES